MEALLDHLDARDVPTCVASSGTHARIRRTLGITGLHPRFDGRIYSATEVVHGKPAPDLFLHAATSMGVPAASCAVVEDSVYGVRAGVAAGMTVYGFAGGLSSAEALAAEGAITFERMTDLLGLRRVIGRIDARNVASARVLTKIGMRHEAHLVQNELFKGEWTDEDDFAVLRAEWEAS